jgi:ferritin-like metal-binding protein YciE
MCVKGPIAIARANLSFMELETLKDLYVHELKDLYSAERQIIKALPKMAKAASNRKLAAAFNQHLEQTKRQAKRLEDLLASHGESTRGPKCQGMEGVLKEGDEMIGEDADEEVRDAGLIAAAQRVEHYEIAGYGCARTYAELLGDKKGAKTLDTTIKEEGDTDKKLTKLARSVINVKAKAAPSKSSRAQNEREQSSGVVSGALKNFVRKVSG